VGCVYAVRPNALDQRSRLTIRLPGNRKARLFERTGRVCLKSLRGSCDFYTIRFALTIAEGKMNAHCRSFIDATFEDDDPDIAKLLRGLHRAARWSLFPYGWWIEADGSFVIFDRRYRPICRKRPDDSVEILPFIRVDYSERQTNKLWIAKIGERWLYTDLTHPVANVETRQRVIGVVQHLSLANEIIRRRETVHRERLAQRKYLRRRAA
jgi:hypothetical protein